jgi:hypothetical protein
MGSDTDRTLCGLGRIRMLVRSECYCRPEGQQHTQARYPFRDRPHDDYPTNVFFESISKQEMNATKVRRATLILYEGSSLLVAASARVGLTATASLMFDGTDPFVFCDSRNARNDCPSVKSHTRRSLPCDFHVSVLAPRQSFHAQLHRQHPCTQKNSRSSILRPSIDRS